MSLLCRCLIPLFHTALSLPPRPHLALSAIGLSSLAQIAQKGKERVLLLAVVSHRHTYIQIGRQPAQRHKKQETERGERREQSV
ncbi:MAG: hypothetical protein JOS17DRAFT_757053 [Linnemannia elongata]|nr:MAG: hypothetical protein JOS17DRAFT_757053 [Linnemannia elongata]